MLIPPSLRRPLDPHHLRFGRIGWLLLHFVLIASIFLAGYYVGRMT
ncbi:hypothetical protein [Gorillibacterium sp. sgz5001074]